MDHPPSSASGPSETGDRAQIAAQAAKDGARVVVRECAHQDGAGDDTWACEDCITAGLLGVLRQLTAQAAKLEAAQSDLSAMKGERDEWREKAQTAYVTMEHRDTEREFHVSKLEQTAAWAANRTREAEAKLEAAEQDVRNARAQCLRDVRDALTLCPLIAGHVEVNGTVFHPLAMRREDAAKALDKLEAALSSASARPAEQAVPAHRCSGCGHRWDDIRHGFVLHGAELCGDCWRKAQPVLHGTAAGADAGEPAPRRDGWLPIETAPPAAGHTVLVYMKGTAGLGIYRAVFADWQDGESNPRWQANSYGHVDDFPPDSEITHWMLLPAPPQAEAPDASRDAQAAVPDRSARPGDEQL